MAKNEKPGFGRAFGAAALCFGAIAIVSLIGKGDQNSRQERRPLETFSLVHAIGNTEQVSGKGLSKQECENRKRDLKVVAEALGSYNERTGYGSITCLPD